MRFISIYTHPGKNRPPTEAEMATMNKLVPLIAAVGIVTAGCGSTGGIDAGGIAAGRTTAGPTTAEPSTGPAAHPAAAARFPLRRYSRGPQPPRRPNGRPGRRRSKASACWGWTTTQPTGASSQRCSRAGG